MSDGHHAHAQGVRELWETFGKGQNRRVPITFACDEQLWLKVSGDRFEDFYKNPETHLRAQLEGQRWFRSHVLGDMQPGSPDTWQVIVRDWMDENDFFGCEVAYQEDDYAWGLPIGMPKQDLLPYMRDLDPERQVRESHSYRMYCALRELTEGMFYFDRPVHVVPPGGSTTGIFTKGAEIRGIDVLCLDLYDDPDFASQFLEHFTDLTLSRIRAWAGLVGAGEPGWPTPDGFHFCDDSIQILSPDLYEQFVMPCHHRLYRAMTTGTRKLHLCGHASQHFEALTDRLEVTAIDGPGTFVDHGKYLSRFGTDFSFAAQMDHGVLEQGTPEQVSIMMRDLMAEDAKVPGRFQLMGFVNRVTPLENVRACYEAGREFGRIG